MQQGDRIRRRPIFLSVRLYPPNNLTRWPLGRQVRTESVARPGARRMRIKSMAAGSLGSRSSTHPRSRVDRRPGLRADAPNGLAAMRPLASRPSAVIATGLLGNLTASWPSVCTRRVQMSN